MMNSCRQVGVSLLSATMIFWSVGMASAEPPHSSGQAAPTRAPVSTLPTLWVHGDTQTWLSLTTPPFNAVITVKMKLERVGFTVVLNRQQPHEGSLGIHYEERPGRLYPRLQQGTTILCEVVYRPPADTPVHGEFRHRMDASTGWPTPVGSLYWDAVRDLEEQPYFYFLAELLEGWLRADDDAVAVFSRMLQEPPIPVALEGSSQLTGQVIANQGARLNAIAELGRLHDRRALPALLFLITTSDVKERAAAVSAMGEMGDPSVLASLRALQGTETQPQVKKAIEVSILRLQPIP